MLDGCRFSLAAYASSTVAARTRENSALNNKAAIAAQATTSVQQQSQQQPRLQQLQMPQNTNMGGIQPQLRQQQFQPAPPAQAAQQSLFGQQPWPTLSLNASGLQHSGLRTSQSPIPATSGFGFQNNPTVSSVYTPTLSAQPMQQRQTFSPDVSVLREDDFAGMPTNMNIGNMNVANMNLLFGFGANDLGLDLCIDEPAKRLYSPNGGFSNQRALQQQFEQFGLGQGQYGNNTAAMREALRQQQMMAMNGMGNPAAVAMMMAGEEHKPFRCPVIGCEKAYKNQNGLKYVIITFCSQQMLTSPDITRRTATRLNNYMRTATVHSLS